MALPATHQLLDHLAAADSPADTVEATTELLRVVRDQQGKDDAVARILQPHPHHQQSPTQPGARRALRIHRPAAAAHPT